MASDVFPGDSEMAQRMRRFDWSATDLGPPERWPQNLRIALGICLGSRFPMHVWWGPGLTLFYNDAYISFLGATKHPAVLGRSGREAWAEVWPTIGPMIDRVRTTGRASWSEDTLMFFDRNPRREEVYVTFSFSPVLGATGQVDGLFCACTETTDKLIGNRRLETLRMLGVRAAEAQTVAGACLTAVEVLARNPYDIPFSAIYILDPLSGTLRRQSPDIPGARLPEAMSIDGPDASPWPLAAVARSRQTADLPSLAARGIVLRWGPWPEPVRQAMVVPIPGSAHDSAAGVLVLGISPCRALDPPYRSFFELAAVHLGTAITDARAYELERGRAAQLAELDRVKTTFFGNVSHELRTPLTLILAPVEDLLAGTPPLPPPARVHLETAHRNIVRLLKLVNTLLDFSRIEAGRMQGSFEPTDLGTATADLASVFRAAIERAGLRLTVRCAPLPGPVYVDRDMWERIVLNLLSNALKFTFEGEIEIALREGDQRALLTVRDTGVGVAREDQARVFERFHRVKNARSRTHEGSGIGLALVQDLVRMHGGTIGLDSQPGQGATFTVALPFGSAHLPEEQLRRSTRPAPAATRAEVFVAEALRWLPDGGAARRPEPAPPPAARAEAPAPGGQSAAQAARILIADDNADMRDYLARLLGSRWEVETVADGAAAMEALRRAPFDLVLTDVMMPQLDGRGLLARLRGDPALRAIPVILLSARAGEQSRVDGLRGGADDYMVKPFSAREIVARVESNIRLARLRRAQAASRAKDDLLAVVSHELRTPTAAILLWGRLLASGRLPEADRGEALQSILRSAEAQNQLIEDLLDVSRISAGRLRLERAEVCLCEALGAVVESVRPAADAKGVALGFSSHVPAGLLVHGDRHRLRQIFANLLGNAIKFTPAGGRVDVVADRAGGRARIVVRDTGCGIRAEDLGRIFDRFEQTDARTTRRHAGLGLGLAIARELVELHDGALGVSSPGEDQGATFTVEIPTAGEEAAPGTRPRGQRRAAGDPRRAGRPLAGVRVLLVEDNAEARRALATVLEEAGGQVTAADSVAAGLRGAAASPPDVVVSDICMPGEDGYALIRHLHAAASLRGRKAPPALALTARVGEDRDRALAAGFNAFSSKPIAPEELVRLVTSLRGARAPRRAGRRPAAARPVRPSPT